MIDASQVSACLVTRGDVDLDPILATLPYDEVVVWDNSTADFDAKVAGRYFASLLAKTPVIYFQDDDCIFHDHAALLGAYEPGVLVANWGHGVNPDGYDDLAIFPGGALVDRALIWPTLAQYLSRYPMDDGFLYEADFIFGCIAPHRHVRLPFEIRDAAYNGHRLADQPWQRDLKLEITLRARAIRDGAL